jgi:hypothetical protein
MNKNITYWFSILLYFLQPNQSAYLKAAPLLVLAYVSGNSPLLNVGFLAASFGDFLLHNDYDVFWGIIAFVIANCFFAADFFYENYYELRGQGVVLSHNHVLDYRLSIVWLIFAAFVHFHIIESRTALLIIFYSLALVFSFYQSCQLGSKRQATKFFMFMFLISDCLVLLQFIPSVKQYLTYESHVAGLLLYWMGMYGIHLYF